MRFYLRFTHPEVSFEDYESQGMPRPVPSVEDSDGDLLHDSYEEEWGLIPTKADEDQNSVWDGFDDFDNDGFDHLSEMQINTDPL